MTKPRQIDDTGVSMTRTPRTNSRGRRVSTGTVTIAMTEYPSDAPPLVLIHGIGSRSVTWWPVIDELAAIAHLYVVDLRGHGESDKPASGYLLPDYAVDLAAIMDELTLAYPAILGHSLGSLVTLEWAKGNPSRASAIILEDPPLRPLSNAEERFAEWLALASMPLDQVVALFHEENPIWTDEDCQRRAESITMTAPGVFIDLRSDTESHVAAGLDRIAQLAAIESPMLVVYGDLEAGSVTVPDDVARLLTTVAGSQAVNIRGASHNIHRERTGEFLDVVRRFLTPIPR